MEQTQNLMPRPACIVVTADVPAEVGQYPGSDEVMSEGRAVGRVAGLTRIGIHIERLPPGRRSTLPHAEEDEEEFAYVLAGEVDCWLDGHLYRMRAGDFVAFAAGTGVCHTFINNGEYDATLLIGGEASKAHNRIYYSHNPERREQMAPGRWWDDVPPRDRGAHDGLPDALRAMPG